MPTAAESSGGKGDLQSKYESHKIILMRQFPLSWWHTAREPEQFPSNKLRAINFTYLRLKIQLWNPGILCRSSQSQPTTAWSTTKTLFYKSMSPSQPIFYNDSLVRSAFLPELLHHSAERPEGSQRQRTNRAVRKGDRSYKQMDEGLRLRRPGWGFILSLLRVAGRKEASEKWLGSDSTSMEDPRGKSSPESGGLSRTVEKFSHNQTHKQSRTGQQRGPLSMEEMERGREGRSRKSWQLE